MLITTLYQPTHFTDANLGLGPKITEEKEMEPVSISGNLVTTPEPLTHCNCLSLEAKESQFTP